MTNKHPITPPPDLTDKWNNLSLNTEEIFVIAARWGADQELEACCECISTRWNKHDTLCLPLTAHELRAARRPEPPTLKEQALEVLAHSQEGWGLAAIDFDTIRRALEALPNE